MTDEPELTPEYLADWIGLVEDKVWVAERDAAISRWVLTSLLLALGKTGAFDIAGFIQHLRAAAPQHPDYPQAVVEYLDELRFFLGGHKDHEPQPSHGGPLEILQ